jgi:hypothetical protein
MQAAICCRPAAHIAPDLVVATKRRGLQFCTSDGLPLPEPTPRSMRFTRTFEEVRSCHMCCPRGDRVLMTSLVLLRQRS